MVEVEYDVDLVCLLREGSPAPTPLVTLLSEQLLRRYKDLKIKDRCCRIDYAGEFHMDVIPAIYESHLEGGRILIPDRKLNRFLPSCPKLFAEWFDEKAQLKPVFMHSFSNTERIKAANEALVDPLPEYDGMDVEPLRRFVQIFKATRNHYYVGKSCAPPSSIVLTTLAAHSFERAVAKGAYTSMIQVLRVVAEDLHLTISRKINDQGKVCHVLENPKDSRENLLDAWEGDDDAYAEFRKWQALVISFIDQLIRHSERPSGFDTTKQPLVQAFGETAATAAIRGVANRRRSMVLTGTAGVAAGQLSTLRAAEVTRRVPAQTFFGRDTD